MKFKTISQLKTLKLDLDLDLWKFPSVAQHWDIAKRLKQII